MFHQFVAMSLIEEKRGLMKGLSFGISPDLSGFAGDDSGERHRHFVNGLRICLRQPVNVLLGAGQIGIVVDKERFGDNTGRIGVS